VALDLEDALEAFLGTGAGPVRLATARHIARETLEAWRSGRISTAQALRTLGEARELVGQFVRPEAVRQSDAAPSGRTPTDGTQASSPTRGTIGAMPAVRNHENAMAEMRCTCGAIHDHLLPAGVQEIDDREYLELGTCPACGTTLCVRQWTLSSSAKWRASTPASRERTSSSSIPAASVVPPVD
jgi:hypothetical protein